MERSPNHKEIPPRLPTNRLVRDVAPALFSLDRRKKALLAIPLIRMLAVDRDVMLKNLSGMGRAFTDG